MTTLVVFLFHVDFETWKKFLEQRGRRLDKQENYLSGFKLQKPLVESAMKTAKILGVPLILVNQSFSSPKKIAVNLVSKLKPMITHSEASLL